jgi:hypothetical protein
MGYSYLTQITLAPEENMQALYNLVFGFAPIIIIAFVWRAASRS